MKNRSIILLVLLALLVNTCQVVNDRTKLPNIVFILVDDMGYGDLGCYDNMVHRTPNIDRLAENGLKFTDFYAAASVCTPTRAAFLTGSYPRRVSMHRDSKNHCVLIPGSNKGLNPAELTIAEILKSKDYMTGCFGKWHLGDQKVFLPNNHGFDTYFGVPYSNDMSWSRRGDPPLPLVENEDVVYAPAEQKYLTRDCTDKALEFIMTYRDMPFFCYIPYHMPHNPVHASEEFKGKSGNGIYGDAVEEIDFNVGRIIAALDSLQLMSNSIIIFTSDNGAARAFGGSNGPLTGWKGSNFEGGFRVPCVVYWDQTFAKGENVHTFTNIMDFLPTFAEMVNYQLPSDIKIDGISMLNLLREGFDEKFDDRPFFYYYRDQLQAVRKGDWKLFLPLNIKQTRWNRILQEGPGQKLKLINLSTDLAETTDLSEEYLDKTEELMNLAEMARYELGDDTLQGIQQRPAGWIDHTVYLTIKK